MAFVSVTDFLVLCIINNAHYFPVELYNSTVCTHRLYPEKLDFSCGNCLQLEVFCSGNQMSKVTMQGLLGSDVLLWKLGGDKMENTYWALESKLGAFLSLPVYFCALILGL